MSNQKILLVNGSPHEKGCTHTVLTEIASVFRGEGMSADLFWVGTKPIQSCVDCGRCAEKGLVCPVPPIGKADAPIYAVVGSLAVAGIPATGSFLFLCIS